MTSYVTGRLRTCTKCGKSKPLDEFYKRPRNRDGYERHCKPCAQAQQQAYKLANRARVDQRNAEYREKHRDRLRQLRVERYDSEAVRAYQIKYKYGLTAAEWDALFEAQGRACAICRSVDPG